LRIFKIILPFLFLIFLYKYSYISLEPIKSLFYFGDLKLLLIIFVLAILSSFLLYIRFLFCLNIYQIKVNIINIFYINSQAYSFTSFIPGQLGIDAWRIGKLRKLDLTKFKSKLIYSTILEKIMALFSQVFILFFFLIENLFNKAFLSLLTILLIYLIISFSKKIGANFKSIKEFTCKINFDKIVLIFFIFILANFISCFLIKYIATTFMMNYSLKVMSISSILSNIVGVIPISPNGLGISEFVFSEVTQNISNSSSNNAIATIYFSYRIINLFSHFLIYFSIKLIMLVRNKNSLKLK